MPDTLDAVILCGGAGSRLRSVTGNGPKSMAHIADRPFLELLLRQLSRHGARRVVLAVGYQEQAIRDYWGHEAFGLDVLYSSEKLPLGTGGALRNALELIQSHTVLVMNGDSYTDADLKQLIADHSRSAADVSVVVVPVDGRTDSGSVLVDEKGDIKQFEEKKAHSGLKYANAGIYLISRSLITELSADVAISLERGVFPRWLQEERRVHAFVSSTACVDIGTPERYQSAQHLLKSVEAGGRH